MAPSTLKSQWWNWVARQRIDPHLPIHGLRDSFGTWVYETYGVKQAQDHCLVRTLGSAPGCAASVSSR